MSIKMFFPLKKKKNIYIYIIIIIIITYYFILFSLFFFCFLVSISYSNFIISSESYFNVLQINI